MLLMVFSCYTSLYKLVPLLSTDPRFDDLWLFLYIVPTVFVYLLVGNKCLTFLWFSRWVHKGNNSNETHFWNINGLRWCSLLYIIHFMYKQTIKPLVREIMIHHINKLSPVSNLIVLFVGSMSLCIRISFRT